MSLAQGKKKISQRKRKKHYGTINACLPQQAVLKK